MNARVELGNDRIRVGFDAATGALCSLFDVERGVEHLARQSFGRLVRVVAPSATWRTRFADSHTSSAPNIERGDQSLHISWEGLTARDGRMPVSVSVTAEVGAEDPELRLSVAITNHGTDVLHEVRFPWVGGWSGIDGPTEDRAFAGIIPFELHPQRPELVSFNIGGFNRRRFVAYTNNMLLPLVDVFSKRAGMSYICYLDRPAVGGVVIEDLDPEPESGALSWSWVHMPFVQPGATWTSPVIGIGLHGGGWEPGADRLRRWLDTWWTPPDPPTWLKRSIGLQVMMTRTFDGEPFHRWEDLPGIGEAAKEFGVTDFSIWDPIESIYLRPDDGDHWEEYDHTVRLDALQDSLRKLSASGINTSALVNARLARSRSSVFASFGGDALAVRTVNGSPVTGQWIDCTQISANHAAWRTEYLGQEGTALCQRPPEFQARAEGIMARTLELGFPSIFVDQAFEHVPCLAKTHGHESPDDTHEAALSWISRVRDEVHRRGDGGYVLGETTDVFGQQVLDLMWNWNALAHEPAVLRYVLPEVLQVGPVDHQSSALNRLFALGFQAALTTAELTGTLADFPEFAAHVGRLAALRVATANWVAEGRFRNREGLSSKHEWCFTYISKEGIAVVAAEVSGQSVRVEISLALEALGMANAEAPTLWRVRNGMAAPLEVAGQPTGLAVDLEPYEVVIWTVRRGNRASPN